MFTRTRLLVALSLVGVVAVGGFLLGPALFPGLDPSEEISRDSDAEIQAQDSSSGVRGECTYSPSSGTVRTVFSDGRELFKFRGGHVLEVEPPAGNASRVAVATYEDGVIRRETFPSGTKVSEMRVLEASDTLWYKSDGAPRSAPEASAYPRLWDDIAEFFVSEADHPWGDEWRKLRPPSWEDGGERVFGPVRVFRVAENMNILIFEDGTGGFYNHDGTTQAWTNGDRAIMRYQPPNGPIEYTYHTRYDEDRGRAVCDGEGSWVTVRYDDGFVRQVLFPKDTPRERIAEVEPVCERWEDEQGNSVDPPQDVSNRPFRSFPDLPPLPER